MCDNAPFHLRPCTLLRVTTFQKIHSAKCCVTLLYLRGERRQRPLLKLTLSEPGCHCHTHAHRRTRCAIGLAVQPNLNESETGWNDWDRWPFGTGMTKQWSQQVSLLQNFELPVKKMEAWLIASYAYTCTLLHLPVMHTAMIKKEVITYSSIRI